MVLLSLPSFPASFGGRLKPHADKNPAVRNRRFVSLKYKRLFFLVVLAIALRLSLIGPNLSHVPRPPSPANHKDLGTWSWGRTIWINTYPCRKGSPQEAPCYTYQESKNHGPRQAKSTDSLKISVVPGGDRDLRASAVFMAECWGGALPVSSCWIVCDWMP